MEEAAAGAARMKELRRRRGLSLADVARALIALANELRLPPLPSVASVQRSVARWEAPKPTLPDERYQLLLAHLYARTPAGEHALGAGSDFAEYLHALRQFGESERRTQGLHSALLRSVTDVGGGLLALLSRDAHGHLAAALSHPDRTGEEAISALASVVADVNAQVGSLPMVRLQLLLAPAVETCRRLLAGPLPGPLAPRVREVAIAATTLSARIAFETRDDTASRALYAEATHDAQQLGRPLRITGVHLSHALVTLYSTHGLDRARALVDTAVRTARSGESTLLRARAHALQAEVAARAGQARQARAALGLAWYDMEAGRDDLAHTSFTSAHLRGFEGVCELYIGDPAKAHDNFAESAATLTSAREQVQRAIVTTDQALARIRLNDPRAAVELLHECVDAAAATGGRVSALRLRRTRRELRPWHREDWVADLDDHLLDVQGS